MPGAVGAFPGFHSLNKSTVRAPVNPADKSTIVSIYPRPISDTKISMTPSRYNIAAGSFENPAVLVVGPGSWWKDPSDEGPLLEIIQPSNLVADSFIKDYCNGMVGCNMINSMPGLFWVPGEFTSKEIKVKHVVALENAKAKQQTFWNANIKFANTFWARTNGSPLCISDDMRLAAAELGLEGIEWMKSFSQMQKTNCKACGFLINSEYPICSNCKAIQDPEKAKAMNIQFAM